MKTLYRTTKEQDVLNIKFLYSVIKGEARFIILLNILYSIVTGIMPAITLKVEQKIIFLLNQNCQFNNLQGTFLQIIYFVCALLSIKVILELANYIKGYFSTLNGEKIAMILEKKVLEQYSSIPLMYYDSADFHELTSKVTVSQHTSPDKMFDIFFRAITALFTIISISAVIPSQYVWYIIFPLLGAYLSHLGSIKNTKAKQEYREKTNLDYRRTSYYRDVCTNPAYLHELKIFDHDHFFKRNYRNSREALYVKEMQLNVRTHTWESFFLEFMNVIEKIPYLILLYYVCMGMMTIDIFILITSSLFTISQTLYFNGFYSHERFKRVSIDLDYMRRFMEIKPEREKANNLIKDIDRLQQHKIEFRNVHFHYPDTDVNVLNGVSFCIMPGETVAIVGLNGSGKSTLVKLIMGLYQPQSGQILIDEFNINDYDTDTLRSLFGTVFQDYCKYSLSAREAILLGTIESTFDEEKARKALEECELLEFFDSLPEKLNTSLTKQFDEASMELSEGQWQKLSLARALYSSNSILVFDEPTSAYDVVSEVNFLNNIFAVKKNRTTIIITHRLSTTMSCDKILMIGDGTVLECGSHNELMKANQQYAKLFNTQAEKYKMC